MLKNRKYLGIYIYNGHEIPGGMPQIINKDLFDKVQEKMIANKKVLACKSKSGIYPFGKIILWLL